MKKLRKGSTFIFTRKFSEKPTTLTLTYDPNYYPKILSPKYPTLISFIEALQKEGWKPDGKTAEYIEQLDAIEPIQSRVQ